MNFNLKKISILAVMLLSLNNNVFAADKINPSNIPLETGVGVGVKSNLMFVLDDSGSMDFDFLGDMVNDKMCKAIINQTTTKNLSHFYRNCVSDTSGENVTSAGNMNDYGGDAPDLLYFTPEFNNIYYNPSTTYNAGINYLGASLGNQSITSARRNIYANNTVANLKTELKETYFCKKINPTAGELNDTNVCVRNGINTPNPFNYVTQGFPNATYLYTVAGPTTPHYYKINPTEYCDANGVVCNNNAVTGIPFPIRWCRTTTLATQAAIPTGTNTCQKKYVAGTYRYPRFGTLQRVALPAAQEGNYANWYTYYRTRMLAMKTSVGIAFKDVVNNRRVGFVTINPGSMGTTKFLPIKDFDSVQKQAFYKILYESVASGGTPLREALSRVGRYYAGKSDGINSNMITGTKLDPVQYSCQQNYTLLSTDGYWNGNAGVNLAGNAVPNSDNVNSGYTKRSDGVYDGGLTANSATASLSDVAAYYYNTDLRPAGSMNSSSVDVSADNVPVSSTDTNSTQHMVTYAISLGLDGYLNYTKDYYNGTNADLQKIKTGANNACSWTAGVCNWPAPKNDELSAIDDLWHATISGRGRYFSARNTEDIVSGLNAALTASLVQTSASASAATSSPNITSTDNFLYYTTYRTVKWDGEIAAKTIDVATGDLSATASWSAKDLLNAKTSGLSDTRKIYYIENDSTPSLKDFKLSTMQPEEAAYFTNKCVNLSQCVAGSLTTAQKLQVNTGVDLVNYLRGQSGYYQTNILNPFFREREYVLGDIVNSAPTYVGDPKYNWIDSGYLSFRTANTGRTKALYAGANDGMLHAFNAETGQELWGIIPNQLLNKMYKLADANYTSNHDFYFDGNISVMDAKVGANWRTVLVAGLGSGGNGYIALDVTDPNNPQVLWETCKNSTYCKKNDADFGYSYGNPIITQRYFDSKWVAYVTSGYDNDSGKGIIYELDIADGSILRKLYTSNSSLATGTNQVGLGKINTIYENFDKQNKTKALYAGDLNGDIWKFDLTNGSNTTGILLGTAKGPTNKGQPITTKVEISQIHDQNILFVSTGQYLNPNDLINIDTQSVYAVKDTDTNLGVLRNNNSIIKQTLTGGPISTTATLNPVDWDVDNGWMFDLVSQPGERVNVDTILAVGTLNVISNVPASSICTAGGNAWYYQIDFYTGSALPNQGGVIAKKLYGGLVVGQVIVKLGSSGIMKNFITDASGTVTPTGMSANANVLITPGGSNKKVGWREIYKK